jgi:hypothetical protein
MTFQIVPLPTGLVRALQSGAPDANGQPAEQAVSDGGGNPCRHCLCHIPAGRGMLILAHRPFGALQPYAECGPIFLCADACEAWNGAPGEIPPILGTSPDYLVKGYLASERIAYGTGATVPKTDMAARIDGIFARGDIAFVDIRSARNNCFQARAVPA